MTIVAHEVTALRYTAVCALCRTEQEYEDNFATVPELMSALRKHGWGFIGDPGTAANNVQTKAVCPVCIRALGGFE